MIASPHEDNLLEWMATIQGLKDTPWEGAKYKLSLKFTDDYNSVPPTVTFHTIPFHPNVDKATGRPCIGFLDEPRLWKQSLTVSSILLGIQVLLSNPVLERAVNTDAAEILRFDPSRYWEIVRDCVRGLQDGVPKGGAKRLKADGVGRAGTWSRPEPTERR
uniref:UBC core domain-containing protein n=1 Tax=Callorhinchus milii TaxID=7868 RepID=A0A4W3GCG5_CALMI